MSDFKVNIRHAGAAELRRARVYLREIRAGGSETPSAKAKAEYIYKAWFANHGEEGVASVRPVLERKLSRTDLLGAEVAIAVISGKVEGLTDLLEQSFAEAGPGDLDRIALDLVDNYMLRGEVEKAVNLSMKRLVEAPWQRIGMARAFSHHVLHSVGIAPLLKAVPALIEKDARLRLAREFGPASAPEVPIFCINLDRDTNRMKRAMSVLTSAASQVRRVSAVPGSALPQSFLDRSGIPVRIERRGGIGCQLSNHAVWELIAKTVPEGEYALVAQDDATFIFGPGVGLQAAISAARQEKLDLCFIQLEPVASRFSARPPATPAIELLDPFEVLDDPENRKVTGTGAEGYLVTPAGARRLLDISCEVGMLGAIDCQITAYGMLQPPSGGVAAKAEWARIFPTLDRMRQQDPERFFLRSRIAFPPLVMQSDYGYKPYNLETAQYRASVASGRLDLP